MKALRHLVAVLVLPLSLLAQSTTIRNDSAAVVVNPQNLQGGSLAVDAYGKNWAISADPAGNTQAIVPVSNSSGLNGPLASTNGYFNVGTDTIEAASTTTVLVLTAHAARVGDLIIPTGGTAANVDVAIPVCSTATNSVTLCYPLPATPSTDAIVIRRPVPIFMPKEDAAHTSGDAGIQNLGVVQASGTMTNFSTTQGDYVPFGLNYTGALFTDINTEAIGSAYRAKSILKEEDTTHLTGDAGIAAFGVINTGFSTLATNGDYALPALNALGAQFVDLNTDVRFSSAKSPMKNEDELSATANAGMATLGIVQPLGAGAQTIQSSTTEDYVFPALNLYGAHLVDLQLNLRGNAATSPIKAEDAAAADGDAGFATYFKMQSALTADAANNDWGPPKTDLNGRSIVGFAPPGELVYGCNTAITTATTGAIIAADASNRFYITSWDCTNTGGTASRVILEDGDGNDLANAMLAATTGQSSGSFPSPVAASAVNKAIQINVITSGSSTICCARGFKSVN